MTAPCLRFALAAGAAFGVALFAAELALMVRGGAIGVNVDVDGPAAALIAVVKPALPGLLARVLAVYVAASMLLFAAAMAVASLLPTERHRVATVAIGAFSFVLLAWRKAVERPALFDDLPALRPVLGLLVDHGEPWHPVALAVAAAGIALGWIAWRTPRRLWIVAALALLWLAVALPSWRVEVASPRHPLVVVLGVDALRPDRLAKLGGTRDVTPRLDAFVEDAVLFSAAYTPLAQTEPAWRSLLTARWPHRTGVRYPLTPDARWEMAATFPDRFARAGYQTYFRTDCSRFHFQGAPSGFADRRQPPRGAVNFLLEKLRLRALGLFADNAIGAAWVPEFVDNRALAGIHDPLGYAERLAAELVAASRRGPTLFAFHATAAHFPGDPVHPFYRRYVAATEPLERRLRMVFQPIPSPRDRTGSRRTSEALYDELLAQADAQVGILLDALRRAGRYDDATIVLLSDHGESFHADRPELEGATPAHGARLSDEENRIALAIKAPSARAPATVPGLVRLIDVGPTLLELHRLAPLADVDGVSLTPLLAGRPQSLPPLYAETGFTHALPEAFDARHRAGVPRTFDAYRLREDGVVEISDVLHASLLAEKDIGAFDGQSWIVRAPLEEGGVEERCRGRCPAEALSRWLDETTR